MAIMSLVEPVTPKGPISSNPRIGMERIIRVREPIPQGGAQEELLDQSDAEADWFSGKWDWAVLGPVMKTLASVHYVKLVVQH